ncbi:HAMP domain-containing histidine kinase [Paenibacillus athensensis]|uniref:histidine kinase n=1 Tax=Paenibacillus athensensis TaxID=1967502 RepID=A0A4Y8PY73_9BACL|nr:HAMP domain-containing sensor histidine kinase [Paenibacillus athensensis]MCD1259692.1 HAMP domain-containing histidine kinase [Paenibacillus athensensis]
MSIRLKLLLSYAAMLIVPLLMMVITAALLIVVFRGDVRSLWQQYGQDGTLFENHTLERLEKELWRTAESNPAALADRAYLADIDQELQTGKSALVVHKQGEMVYASPALQNAALLQRPSWSEEASPSDRGANRPAHIEHEEPQRYGSQWLAIVHFAFTNADGTPGTLMIVTTVNPLVNFAREFFPILFIALAIILILTHSLLTYFVSRSIVTPLRELKQAMKRMKAGDLDVQVRIDSKDEIGELSLAFEQMRRELRQSMDTQAQYENNRKELISNISHDLRTPLTALRGYIDGLGDGIADTPQKRQKYMEIISAKAEEMEHLIDELFLYSKLDLKQLPFHFEQVELAAFLADWSEELAFELGKQGVDFTAELDLAPVNLSLDRDKIRRVFANMIDNALKYMNKPEKRLQLRAYAANDVVCIELEDNGLGIDAEALPHIFERFYRADPSRNSHTGGSGLGLAISKQIVEGHGGTIHAASVKGEWTRISIHLPLKPIKMVIPDETHFNC